MDILNRLFIFVLITSCIKFTSANITLHNKRESNDQQPKENLEEEDSIRDSSDQQSKEDLDEEDRGESLYKYNFMAIISYNDGVNASRIIGGGAIINPSWVLTSANCFDDKPNLRYIQIRAGIVLNSSDKNKQQIRSVSSIVVHQNYNKRYYDENSIALVKVWPAFELTKTVNLAHLSPRPFDIKRGTSCHMLGFSENKNGENTTTGFLKIKLDVLDSEKCATRLRLLKSETGPSYKNLCLVNLADRYYEQICTDNIGLPLICDSKLQGVVSNYSIEACHQNSPIIIPDIGHHPYWIKSATLNLPVVVDQDLDVNVRDSNVAVQHNFTFEMFVVMIVIFLL